MRTEYEAPRLTVHGSVAVLTLSDPPHDGEDPCRFLNPADEYKQTGDADLLVSAQAEPDDLLAVGPCGRSGVRATASARAAHYPR